MGHNDGLDKGKIHGPGIARAFRGTDMDSADLSLPYVMGYV